MKNKTPEHVLDKYIEKYCIEKSTDTDGGIWTQMRRYWAKPYTPSRWTSTSGIGVVVKDPTKYPIILES